MKTPDLADQIFIASLSRKNRRALKRQRYGLTIIVGPVVLGFGNRIGFGLPDTSAATACAIKLRANSAAVAGYASTKAIAVALAT